MALIMVIAGTNAYLKYRKRWTKSIVLKGER